MSYMARGAKGVG